MVFVVNGGKKQGVRGGGGVGALPLGLGEKGEEGSGTLSGEKGGDKVTRLPLSVLSYI